MFTPDFAALAGNNNMLTDTMIAEPIVDFASDVRVGLTRSGQKELPSKYLYDAMGSRLFDVIVELPEYGVTRADERLLRRNANEIVRQLPGDVILCELGSGSGRKTRWVLEALARRGRMSYYPIEISRTALDVCQRELADMESVGIVGLESEYLDGLIEVAARRKAGQRILVLFLGSTIGNFTSPADGEFLLAIRSMLQPGDALLLGTDLEKSLSQLLVAYDDPLGVTAAFNLNLLARINRELDGCFDLDQFEHVALFNRETGSVEMHLRSKCRQTVLIRKANLLVRFEEGESIWTENCHKYSLYEVAALAAAAGFECAGQWIDPEWAFAETLMTVMNR